jgi:hypothetical protein
LLTRAHEQLTELLEQQKRELEKYMGDALREIDLFNKHKVRDFKWLLARFVKGRATLHRKVCSQRAPPRC